MPVPNLTVRIGQNTCMLKIVPDQTEVAVWSGTLRIFLLLSNVLITWKDLVNYSVKRFYFGNPALQGLKLHYLLCELQVEKIKKIWTSTMRIWYMYLLHRRASKTQTSLRIRAVSSEPSLLAYTKYGCRWRLGAKLDFILIKVCTTYTETKF